MQLINGLIPLILDIETFFDSKNGYTLNSRRMSTIEYIRDARFHTHGVGVVWPGMAPKWLSGDDMREFLNAQDWSKTALIGHNLHFDGTILAEHFGKVPALYVDTLGMSHAVNGAQLPNHSLNALAAYYGLPEKGQMQTDGIRELTDWQEKELAEYCLHDVELTAEIFERLRHEFPEGEYPMLDWTIRIFTKPALRLDVPLLEEASKAEAARREAFFTSPLALEAAAAAKPAPTFTKAGKPRKVKEVEPKKAFSSNEMFPRVLAHFGYEVPFKPSPTAAKKGEDKTIPALAVGDPEFVELLESDDPKLRALCEARVAAKSTLLETRSAKMAAVGKTGPWPFDIGYSGAKQTHRFSGGPGGGGNPQNLPKRDETAQVLRKAVIPPAGHKLVVGDFAQVELRVLSWLAQDSRLMASIRAGRDLYCEFGTAFYGRTITKADEKERAFAKAAILGLGYGMGWRRFIRHAKIQADQEVSEEEAKRAVNLYRSTYGAVPALWAYLDDLIPQMAAGQKGVLWSLSRVKWDRDGFVLPSGLRIRYPELQQKMVKKDGREELTWGYTAFRQKRQTPDFVPLWGGLMTENLCQGLAGELCKGAIERTGRIPVGTVHDELLAVAPNESAEGYRGLLEEAMTSAPTWWPDICLGAEVKIADNWLEAH